MPFVIACPSCKAKMQAPDDAIGQDVRCPGCGTIIPVMAPTLTAIAADADEPPGDKRSRVSVGDGGPPTETTADERFAAMIFWVLAFVVPTIGPFVWWIARRKDRPFLDHQGKQYLNFSITSFWIGLGLFLVGVAGLFLGFTVHWVGYVGGGLFFLLLLAYACAATAYAVLAMIKAHAGVWYRIPHTWQVFK